MAQGKRSAARGGKQKFTPPLRGGNLLVERFPRVSPWAIFVSSLREERR
jgi:hypothetical protein